MKNSENIVDKVISTWYHKHMAHTNSTNLVDCHECTGEGFVMVEEDRREYEHTCYACRGTGKLTRAEANARLADEKARAAADAEWFAHMKWLMSGGGDDFMDFDPRWDMTPNELAEEAHYTWHQGAR